MAAGWGSLGLHPTMTRQRGVLAVVPDLLLYGAPFLSTGHRKQQVLFVHDRLGVLRSARVADQVVKSVCVDFRELEGRYGSDVVHVHHLF